MAHYDLASRAALVLFQFRESVRFLLRSLSKVAWNRRRNLHFKFATQDLGLIWNRCVILMENDTSLDAINMFSVLLPAASDKHTLVFGLFAMCIAHRLWTIIYRLYFHPLAGFPGPKIAAVTHLYEIGWDYLGNGAYLFHCENLHKKYGTTWLEGQYFCVNIPESNINFSNIRAYSKGHSGWNIDQRPGILQYIICCRLWA